MEETLTFEQNRLDPIAQLASVCYFLGAGFSKASCPEYPTSVGFLTREFPGRESDDRGNEIHYDVKYCGARRHVKGLLERIKQQYGELETLNLEDVMTDLHVRAFGLGRAWEDAEPQTGRPYSVPTFRSDYELLLAYIRVRLRVLDCEAAEHALAQRLLTTLKWQDSVLTLNYDTVVERYLPPTDGSSANHRIRHLDATIGPPYATWGNLTIDVWDSYTTREEGVLAKLHGSVDWLTCPNSDCPNHGYIRVSSQCYGEDVIPPSEARCRGCGYGAETVIVPPTVSKAFERFPKLGLMWLQSYHALRMAQRWTFIGVSFAPTDFHLSALIRSASGPSARYMGPGSTDGQICVVCESLSAAKESARHLVNWLAPEVRRRYDSGEAKVFVFDSVDEYLHEVACVDGGRKDREGPN